MVNVAARLLWILAIIGLKQKIEFKNLNFILQSQTHFNEKFVF